MCPLWFGLFVWLQRSGRLVRIEKSVRRALRLGHADCDAAACSTQMACRRQRQIRIDGNVSSSLLALCSASLGFIFRLQLAKNHFCKYVPCASCVYTVSANDGLHAKTMWFCACFGLAALICMRAVISANVASGKPNEIHDSRSIVFELRRHLFTILPCAVFAVHDVVQRTTTTQTQTETMATRTNGQTLVE